MDLCNVPELLALDLEAAEVVFASKRMTAGAPRQSVSPTRSQSPADQEEQLQASTGEKPDDSSSRNSSASRKISSGNISNASKTSKASNTSNTNTSNRAESETSAPTWSSIFSFESLDPPPALEPFFLDMGSNGSDNGRPLTASPTSPHFPLTPAVPTEHIAHVAHAAAGKHLLLNPEGLDLDPVAIVDESDNYPTFQISTSSCYATIRSDGDNASVDSFEIPNISLGSKRCLRSEEHQLQEEEVEGEEEEEEHASPYKGKRDVLLGGRDRRPSVAESRGHRNGQTLPSNASSLRIDSLYSRFNLPRSEDSKYVIANSANTNEHGNNDDYRHDNDDDDDCNMLSEVSSVSSFGFSPSLLMQGDQRRSVMTAATSVASASASRSSAQSHTLSALAEGETSPKASPKISPKEILQSQHMIEATSLEKLEQLERLEKLERLERLEKLERLERLERLGRFEGLGRLDSLDKHVGFRLNNSVSKLPTINSGSSIQALEVETKVEGRVDEAVEDADVRHSDNVSHVPAVSDGVEMSDNHQERAHDQERGQKQLPMQPTTTTTTAASATTTASPSHRRHDSWMDFGAESDGNDEGSDYDGDADEEGVGSSLSPSWSPRSQQPQPPPVPPKDDASSSLSRAGSVMSRSSSRIFSALSLQRPRSAMGWMGKEKKYDDQRGMQSSQASQSSQSIQSNHSTIDEWTEKKRLSQVFSGLPWSSAAAASTSSVHHKPLPPSPLSLGRFASVQSLRQAARRQAQKEQQQQQQQQQALADNETILLPLQYQAPERVKKGPADLEDEKREKKEQQKRQREALQDVAQFNGLLFGRDTQPMAVRSQLDDDHSSDDDDGVHGGGSQQNKAISSSISEGMRNSGLFSDFDSSDINSGDNEVTTATAMPLSRRLSSSLSLSRRTSLDSLTMSNLIHRHQSASSVNSRPATSYTPDTYQMSAFGPYAAEEADATSESLQTWIQNTSETQLQQQRQQNQFLLRDQDGVFRFHPRPPPPVVYEQDESEAGMQNPQALPGAESSLAQQQPVPGLPPSPSVVMVVPLPKEVVEMLQASVSCFPATMLSLSSISIQTIRTYSRKMRRLNEVPGLGDNPRTDAARSLESSATSSSIASVMNKHGGGSMTGTAASSLQRSSRRRWNFSRRLVASRTLPSSESGNLVVGGGASTLTSDHHRRSQSSWTPFAHFRASSNGEKMVEQERERTQADGKCFQRIFPNGTDYQCDALYAHILAYNYVGLVCLQYAAERQRKRQTIRVYVGEGVAIPPTSNPSTPEPLTPVTSHGSRPAAYYDSRPSSSKSRSSSLRERSRGRARTRGTGTTPAGGAYYDEDEACEDDSSSSMPPLPPPPHSHHSSQHGSQHGSQQDVVSDGRMVSRKAAILLGMEENLESQSSRPMSSSSSFSRPRSRSMLKPLPLRTSYPTGSHGSVPARQNVDTARGLKLLPRRALGLKRQHSALSLVVPPSVGRSTLADGGYVPRGARGGMDRMPVMLEIPETDEMPVTPITPTSPTVSMEAAMQELQTGLYSCIQHLVSTLKLTTGQMEEGARLDTAAREMDPLFLRTLCELVRTQEE